MQNLQMKFRNVMGGDLSRRNTFLTAKPQIFVAQTISQDARGDNRRRILARILAMRRNSKTIRLRLKRVGKDGVKQDDKTVETSIDVTYEDETDSLDDIQPEQTELSDAERNSFNGGADTLTEEQVSEFKEAFSLFVSSEMKSIQAL